MKKKQWADPSPNDQAEQHYLIEPRHLAGGGDLRHVSEFLRASGWKDQSMPGGPLAFASPDSSVRVSYDPYTQPGGWTIRGEATAQQETWVASLGRQAPVEIVAGLTDALTQPRTAHAPNPWAPLREQRWHPHHGEHFTATSPESGAWLQFHQTGPGQAYWWAGALNEHGQGWNATFSQTTPMHLVEAFTAALADPEPVMRPRGHVPPSQRIRTRSVSVRPSQLRAWQQGRVSAARAAAWARTTWATSRSRTAPAGRPYAAQGGRTR
ncbi:DUF317 domain-containing protein [Streptomyces sp. NPDC050161]|uniref:DUF317 domain-containing protein n=1 Tax=Streptomyces sp. NPDC050161 TaxID=3365604 RepID=UPI0037BD922E